MSTFHYTDKKGHDGIQGEPWRFQVHQPRAKERPLGAYFTNLAPTAENLRVLHKKIRVPKKKRAYVFCFNGTSGLGHLNEARGRDQYILYSQTEYTVENERKEQFGLTEQIAGTE